MKKFYLSFVSIFICLTAMSAENTMSLQDITTEEGVTEVLLPILLTNENSITGFQCDLYLPSGVTVATDEYGDYIIDMARTTTKRHTISSSLQPDGSLRILCTSMTNATFSGNSGVVLNVTLNVSEGMIAGTYNINLKNIVLSDPDANRYTSSNVTSVLTVTGMEPVTITANDITMVYGDALPELSYTSSGGLVGVPQLSCSATSKSPVGTYPITISKGSVENYNVSYVSGILTIVKAPLTVSVDDYTRKEGEENPVFEIVYEGFKNDETESVLKKLPIAFTTATKDSPAGMYDILISGGEADNYRFEYEYGILTVEIVDDISSPDIDVQLVDVYSIEGMLVKKQISETELREILPKGIFIVNGKKIAIR